MTGDEPLPPHASLCHNPCVEKNYLLQKSSEGYGACNGALYDSLAVIFDPKLWGTAAHLGLSKTEKMGMHNDIEIAP